jgi:uracil-DNA glycosylase family 4
LDDLWLKQSGNRKISLPEWQELCQQCQRCSLREGARNVVFGEGNPQAKLIFIGEGPGAEEDRLGRPFVGAAGRLLDHILAAGGWSREEIYIANVVKCRPPGNRPPKRTEIQSCLPLLQKQLALIAPRIIVALGASAAKTLLDDPYISITRERGHWHKIDKYMLMPTFHPAALLRDPRKKKPVWKDIQQVMALYQKIRAEEGDTLP